MDTETMFIVIGTVGGTAFCVAALLIARNEYVYISNREPSEPSAPWCACCGKFSEGTRTALRQCRCLGSALVAPERKKRSSKKAEDPAKTPQRVSRSTLLPAVDIMQLTKQMRRDNLIDEAQAKKLSDMVVNGDGKLIALVQKHHDPEVALTRNERFMAALVLLSAKRTAPAATEDEQAEKKAAAAKTRLKHAARLVTLADWSKKNDMREEDVDEEQGGDKQWKHTRRL